jgi:thiaminase (transcriptional activator TenA)
MINCAYLRRNADRIWTAIFEHPFVRGIGEGTLVEDKFRFYLKQDYVYLIEFSRFFSLAAAKAGKLDQMQTFSKILDATLNLEMDLHRKICADYRITPEELESTEPAPNNLGYTSYLQSVAYSGDLVEILAALLPCSWGYIEIVEHLKKKGLPEHKHYRQWIETYTSNEFVEMTDWLKATFDRLSEKLSEDKAGRVQEIFNFSSLWELLFWEMAYYTQEWPVKN